MYCVGDGSPIGGGGHDYFAKLHQSMEFQPQSVTTHCSVKARSQWLFQSSAETTKKGSEVWLHEDILSNKHTIVAVTAKGSDMLQSTPQILHPGTRILIRLL